MDSVLAVGSGSEIEIRIAHRSSLSGVQTAMPMNHSHAQFGYLKLHGLVRAVAYETIAGDLNEFVDTVQADTTEAVIDPLATAAKGVAGGDKVNRIHRLAHASSCFS